MGGGKIAQTTLEMRQQRVPFEVIRPLRDSLAQLLHQRHVIGRNVRHRRARLDTRLGLCLAWPLGSQGFSQRHAVGQRQIPVARCAKLHVDAKTAADEHSDQNGREHGTNALARSTGSGLQCRVRRENTPRHLGAHPFRIRFGQDIARHVAFHLAQLVAVDIEIIGRRRTRIRSPPHKRKCQRRGHESGQSNGDDPEQCHAGFLSWVQGM